MLDNHAATLENIFLNSHQVYFLPGDNNRAMGSANFTVTINEKGEFTSVVVGSGKDAKTYTVEEWNKKVLSTSLDANIPAKPPANNSGRGGNIVF